MEKTANEDADDNLSFEEMGKDDLLNPSHIKTPEKAQPDQAVADINWGMFDIVSTLGSGAFG